MRPVGSSNNELCHWKLHQIVMFLSIMRMDGRLNTGYEENQYRVYIAVEEFEKGSDN